MKKIITKRVLSSVLIILGLFFFASLAVAAKGASSWQPQALWSNFKTNLGIKADTTAFTEPESHNVTITYPQYQGVYPPGAEIKITWANNTPPPPPAPADQTPTPGPDQPTVKGVTTESIQRFHVKVYKRNNGAWDNGVEITNPAVIDALPTSSQSWTPSAEGRYRIKIGEHTNPGTIYAYSGEFTVGQPPTPPPTPPPVGTENIEFTIPATGTTYNFGDTVTTKWETNIASPFTVKLSLLSTDTSTPNKLVKDLGWNADPNVKRKEFRLWQDDQGNPIPAGSYKIKAEKYDPATNQAATPQVVAESNPFNVKPGAYLELTSPINGETWDINQDHEITWRSNDFIRDNTLKVIIGTCSDPNACGNTIESPILKNLNLSPRIGLGKATILASELSSLPSGDKYAIQISDTNTQVIGANQKAIKLQNSAPAQSITVSQPDGNTAFKVGDNVPITWTAPGVTGNVKTELCALATCNQFGGTIVASTGSTNMSTAGITQTDIYYIKVTSVDNAQISGSSKEFAITVVTPPPTSDLKFTAPTADARYTTGQEMDISWTVPSNASGNVDLALMKKGNPNQLDGIQNVVPIISGIWKYKISDAITIVEGSDYKIRLTTATGNQIFSPYFTISRTALRINLQWPPQNGQMAKSPDNIIVWTGSPKLVGETVKISLAKSTGLPVPTNYVPLGEAKSYLLSNETQAAGLFRWDTTLAAGAYRVKVSLAGKPTVSDYVDVVIVPEVAKPAIVTGKVLTQSTNKPIQDAQITFYKYDKDGKARIYPATTNAKGNFTSGKIPVRSIFGEVVRVHIRKDGYTSINKNIRVYRNRTTNLGEIRLTQPPDTTRKGHVTGSVKDSKTNNKLVGVTVLARAMGDGKVYGSKDTDQSGVFLINDLPAGDYKLELIKEGYDKKITDKIVIQASAIKEVKPAIAIKPTGSGGGNWLGNLIGDIKDAPSKVQETVEDVKDVINDNLN